MWASIVCKFSYYNVKVSCIHRKSLYSLTRNTVSLKVISSGVGYVLWKVSMYWGNVLMGLRVCSVCVAAGARGAGVGAGGVWTAGDLRTGAGSGKSVATMATIGVDNCKVTFSFNHFYRELKLTKHKSSGMPLPVSCLFSSSTDRWLYPIILRPRFFF